MKSAIITSENKVYSNEGNQAVLNLVQGNGCKILDIGCGAGDNAKVLVNKGHLVDGITLSKEESLICKPVMRYVWVYNVEGGLPLDVSDTYDYILCSHVLEHVAYPKKLLMDIRQSLKPGGKLIVALPNIMHYQSRIKLILGNFNYDETGIWDYTHLRWYTYKTGAELLQDNGFKVIASAVDGDLPLLTLFRFIPYKIRKIIYSGLTMVSKGMFGSQLLYVASADE